MKVIEQVDHVGLTLQKAGLPTHPHAIIGHLYQFQCQGGSWPGQILFGTVTSITIFDGGEINLHVSSPVLNGMQLISLRHSDGNEGWWAYLGVGHGLCTGELKVF